MDLIETSSAPSQPMHSTRTERYDAYPNLFASVKRDTSLEKPVFRYAERIPWPSEVPCESGVFPLSVVPNASERTCDFKLKDARFQLGGSCEILSGRLCLFLLLVKDSNPDFVFSGSFPLRQNPKF